VAAGRLDRRLFDVSLLIRDGYDDRSSKQTPLIVEPTGATAQRRPHTALPAIRTVRALPSIGATAVRADKGTAFWSALRGSAAGVAPAGLSAAGVGHIWLDGKVHASLDQSVPQIGGPQAWAAGFTGQGSTVAVLDTGIDTTHPDLSDAVAEAKDFTDSSTGTDDYYGHGTHVASIITGNGAKYRGVAPDAKLLNGKVLNDTGSGDDSGIIAGMEWAAARHADVVNMSFGGGLASDGTEPLDLAVNRLTEQTGALFVVAAGNDGPDAETISSPASADEALTVGAVDRQDALADFSSRGPRWGNPAIKPDITAPGVGIVAARAAHAVIGGPVGDGYLRLSGTSMAAPHVAGAAAIVKSEHPDWTAEAIKAALMGSAKPTAGLSVYEQGAGRVDLAREVSTPAYATPAKLDQGVVQWPHDDDQPIAKTLTYHNLGSTPLTLDLAADVRDATGAAAPAALFTVSPQQLTIPAGGSAAATVSTDTRVNAPNSLYGGVITATGSGGTLIRTPIGVTKEVESYNVTLHFLDHNGSPTDQYFYRFIDLRNGDAHLVYNPSGTTTVRLPKGHYYLDGFIDTLTGPDTSLNDNIVEPDYDVTGDSEVTFDARDGQPLGFVVDQPNARPGEAEFGFGEPVESGSAPGAVMFGANFDGITINPSRTSRPGFTFDIEARLAEPDRKGHFYGSPYQYNLDREVPDRVPAQLVTRVHDRDLAKVRSAAAAESPGRLGVWSGVASNPLPFTLTEYYTPDTPWFDEMCQQRTLDQDSPDTCVTTANGVPFHRGRTSVQYWNAAVFGPGLPFGPDLANEWAARLGDELQFGIPMFADQDANRYGFSTVDGGTTVLYRDGVKVGDSPFDGTGDFTVPAGSATYRLHTATTRSQVSTLSTSITADWTFRSDTVAGADPKPLRLLVVRFAPQLDDHNQARAGRPFTIPVFVQRNGQDGVVPLRALTVRVSYDDGRTWHTAPVVRVGNQWRAVVTHPAKAQYVSLQASARDRGGNAVEETIIRAYALR
jgi:subtilisin family serine protease